MGSSGYNPKTNEGIKNISNNELLTNYIKIDEERQKIYNSIPKDQFVCHACGEIPELLNIHTDNGCIEFKCKTDGALLLTIDQYFKKLSESNFTYYKTKCCKCNKIQKNYKKKEQIFKYCYICKKDYCYDCINKPEHQQFHLKQCIPINEKCIRCPDHFNEGVYTSFCITCQENICEENSKKIHKGHKRIDFFKIETKKKEIINKNKILSDIIKFNELILNTYERLPDNYFNIINLSNLIESIKAENSRNSKELEDALKLFEAKINSGKRAIEMFNKKYNLSLTGNEEELSLKNKGLNDDDLKILSMIYFKKLKDLDLSYNKFKDIIYLKDMNTSNLKYLNLGHNEIEDIQILDSLVLENLKELGLQNNKIKNISSLLKSNLSSLELLRLEGNEIDRSMSDFKQILKKYSKKLVYAVQTFKDFNKKYDVNISEECKEINLSVIKKGNDILKDLYILSSNYDNLKKFYLSDCKIDNIFELSRMSFKKLEILDLSLNEIKNIDILPNLKCSNLKYLFLNDNQIKNITPLKHLKFKSLISISIKDNNFLRDSQEIIKIKTELDKKNIVNDI